MAVDRDRAAGRFVDAHDRSEQGRLARAVAAHDGHDLAASHFEVDAAQRGRLAVASLESGDPHEGLSGRGCDVAHVAAPRRKLERREPAAEPSGLAHGQGHGIPADEPAKPGHRRTHREPADHLGRLAGHDRASLEAEGEIDEAGDPFESVLGEQHGHALVVHEPLQGGDHVLGALRVELGGRLVEHEDARPRCEGRCDRDPLLLAARERPHASPAQRFDVEQVEHLLDAPAHVHRVDARGSPCRRRARPPRGRARTRPRRPGARSDGVGEGAWGVLERVATVDDHTPGEPTAGEVGDQPVRCPQERRLAGAGGPDRERERSLVDRDRGVVQRGPVRVGVGERDGVEAQRAHRSGPS